MTIQAFYQLCGADPKSAWSFDRKLFCEYIRGQVCSDLSNEDIEEIFSKTLPETIKSKN